MITQGLQILKGKPQGNMHQGCSAWFMTADIYLDHHLKCYLSDFSTVKLHFICLVIKFFFYTPHSLEEGVYAYPSLRIEKLCSPSTRVQYLHK
jgi:hypothetical protein